MLRELEGVKASHFESFGQVEKPTISRRGFEKTLKHRLKLAFKNNIDVCVRLSDASKSDNARGKMFKSQFLTLKCVAHDSDNYLPSNRSDDERSRETRKRRQL